MKWKRGIWREDQRRLAYSTITIINQHRRVEWCVYRLATKSWAIGVGVVGERGLHTVVAFEVNKADAQKRVRATALALGHTWH